MTGTDTSNPPEVPIDFKKNGSDLAVELTCGEAQLGTYTLRLWSPDGLTVFFSKYDPGLQGPLPQCRSAPAPGRATADCPMGSQGRI